MRGRAVSAAFPARDYTRRRHPFSIACAKRHPPGRGKSGGGGEVPPANGMMTCKVGRTVGATRRQGAAGRQRRREYTWRKRRSRVFRVVRSWVWAAPRSRARRLPGWRGALRKAAAMRPRRRRRVHRAERRAACRSPKATPRPAPTWPACTAGRSRPKPSPPTRSRTPRTATCSSSARVWAAAAPPSPRWKKARRRSSPSTRTPRRWSRAACTSPVSTPRCSRAWWTRVCWRSRTTTTSCDVGSTGRRAA